MKKLIFILTLIFVFCNHPISANQSKYNVYSPNLYPAENIDSENEKIMFIVDFSNSMNEFLGNRRKIDVALYALKGILPNIPKSAQIGLRVYGHRGGITPVDACMASKKVVPIDYDNFKKIYYELERIAPSGMTPITYSIKQALKNDFGLWQGQKRIVILTDGGENCDESPCNYAIKLISQRNDVKIDVIAFSLDDDDGLNQLKCAALVTGGKFYNADTYANLVDSLQNSFNAQKNVEATIINK